MTSFGMRMLRAAWLDADTYEEIEADRSSIWQAMVVVLGACTAIGVARYVQSSGAGIPANPLVLQVALSIASGGEDRGSDRCRREPWVCRSSKVRPGGVECRS